LPMIPRYLERSLCTHSFLDMKMVDASNDYGWLYMEEMYAEYFDKLVAKFELKGMSHADALVAADRELMGTKEEEAVS